MWIYTNFEASPDQLEALNTIIMVYKETLHSVLSGDSLTDLMDSQPTVEIDRPVFDLAFEREASRMYSEGCSVSLMEMVRNTYYRNTDIRDQILKYLNKDDWVSAGRCINKLPVFKHGKLPGIAIPMSGNNFNKENMSLLIPGASSDVKTPAVLNNGDVIDNIAVRVEGKGSVALEATVTKQEISDNVDNSEKDNNMKTDIDIGDKPLLDLMPFPDHWDLLLQSSHLKLYQASLIHNEEDHDNGLPIEIITSRYIAARKKFIADLGNWITHNTKMLTRHYIYKENRTHDPDGGILFPLEDECSYISKAVSNVVMHTIKQTAVMRKPHQNVTVKDLLIAVDTIIDRECASHERTIRLLKTVASSLLLFGLADLIEDRQSTSYLTVLLDLIRPEWVPD
jgi:hypothetical protein